MFWLSFCDQGRPEGEQFLGACIVRAMSFIEAVQVSHVLEINPGGEVQGHQVEYEAEARNPIPVEYLERLLSREDCQELERKVMGQ